MPLNFPSNPSLNDTYTLGDKKWVYDGKGWKLFSASFELVPIVYAHANGAFDKANSANSLAQAAFDAANNAGSSAEIQTIFTHANGAFDKANSANVLAQNAYNYANTISLVGYATESYVNNTVANLVNSAPATLDTLNELAAALGNDANFSTTVTNLIGSAYNQANSANVLAQAAYNQANTDVTSISTTAGVYGNNTIVPVITLEANGRISSIVNVAISGIGGGTATLTWIKKTANYTANVGERIIADTTSGIFTLTLPATPEVGDSVVIADGSNWYANNLTVARNGSTIEGMTEDLILDVEGIQVEFVYDGTTWEVYSFSGPSPFPSPTGNTGRLLTTDGNITSWSVITESYVNASFNQANLAFNTANSISGITTATPNTLVQRDSFADIYANNLYANNLVSTSDIRFKNDIQSIDNPIELLNSLNGVSFKWINTETKSYGLIAQELEKVMPELVSTTNDTKSVMYIPIIAILIEAIKQQQKEIEEIRNGKT